MPHYINIPAETSIWYEQRGSGFPLLLLPPGGLNATTAFWQRTAFNAPEVFSRHFHVITIDERNAGNSSGPLDVNDPWAGFAQDHAGLMNHLGFERFHVLGSCVGSSHALRLMQVAPTRVAAAVLVQPVGIDDNNRQTLPNAWVDWAKQMRERRPDLDEKTLEAYGKKMWGGEFVLSVTRDWLKTCQTPALVLPGIDAAHPNAIGKEIAALLPGAEKLEPWKEPAERVPPAIDAIVRFLKKHTPA